MTIENFFIGAVIVTIGVLMVFFNKNLAFLFPESQLLRRYIGGGTSFIVFYIIAFLTIMFGFMMMFGWLDDFGNFLLPGESAF